MAEIRWTEESAQWLQDIYEYISADNPDAAEKVISTIYQKAQVLIEHPEIGYTYETVSGTKGAHSSLRPLSNNLPYKGIRGYRYCGCLSWLP